MSDFDPTAGLERAVLNTDPHETHDLQNTITQADLGADFAEAASQAPVPEIIGPEVWAQQWGLMHDMMGGVVHMRTGQPCDLGAQARSEGGLIACNAAYELIAMSPARNMILGAHSGFFGQVIAVGMHGFSCVQIVKASAIAGHHATVEAQAVEGASFKSQRAEAA